MRLRRSRRWRAALRRQRPAAMVLSCADSRVPAEILFGLGPGDLFVNRIAGNIPTAYLAGSLEFGAAVLKIPLLVVLGHTGCGAVASALGLLEGAKPATPNLKKLLAPILPAARRARKGRSPGPKRLEAAVRENVRETIRRLRFLSPMLRSLERRGRLCLQGAVYHLETGEVEWLEDEKESC